MAQMQSYENWCTTDGDWMEERKACGKEYSGRKSSVSIPDIFLKLAIEPTVAAKKKKMEEKVSPIVYFF